MPPPTKPPPPPSSSSSPPPRPSSPHRASSVYPQTSELCAIETARARSPTPSMHPNRLQTIISSSMDGGASSSRQAQEYIAELGNLPQVVVPDEEMRELRDVGEEERLESRREGDAREVQGPIECLGQGRPSESVEEKGEKVGEEERICGLIPAMFWAVVVLIVCLLAAGIGVGLGMGFRGSGCHCASSGPGTVTSVTFYINGGGASSTPSPASATTSSSTSTFLPTTTPTN